MKIFLIGPGGTGKSTTGKILAKLLGYDLVDLDTEFCQQIENIGTYIDKHGYEKYCFENSELFYKLLNKSPENIVMPLSSGFLVHEEVPELAQLHKQTLKTSGLSILLLPDESLVVSTRILLERQLSRGFGLKEDREKTKITHRLPIYKELGDIKIFSHEKPEIIAERMKEAVIIYNKKK